MVWLAGLGFAVLCLHAAIAPAFWAAGLSARIGGIASKRLIAIATLCGLTALTLIGLNWPIYQVLLDMSPVKGALAAIGVVALVRLALLAVRNAKALRVGDLRPQGSDDHPELSEALQDAADAVELTTVPKLAVIDGTASPAVTGLANPVLLFPSNLKRLEPDRLQIVLAHELAHVKLGHLLWSHVSAVLAQVLWPSPLAQWVRDGVRDRMEIEADAAVAQLNFTHSQIRETRREVLSFMRSGNVKLAFAPDPSMPQNLDGSRSGGLWKAALELAIVLVSIAGALLPQGVLARPSVLGYPDHLDSSTNPYRFQFATSVGDWVRTRYDAVYVQAGCIYRVRGDGAFRRTINRRGDVGEPNISRDGSRIVFVGEQDLWLTDGDGNTLERLTKTPDSERRPWLSPDGRLLVYSVLGGRSYPHNQIMLMDLETRAIRNLSDQAGPGVEPSFARDGMSILYMNEGNVYRVGLDGRNSRQISQVRNRGGRTQTDLHGPIESTDRQWIFVTRVYGDLENYWYRIPPDTKQWEHYTISVWAMRPDGSQLHEVVPPVKGQLEFSLFDIAPTGIWVACGLNTTDRGGPKATLWEFDMHTQQGRPLPGEYYTGLSYTGWLR